MSNRKPIIISEFYCTKCGQKGIPLARDKGNQHSNGHLKKLFCYHCREETNHVEIKTNNSSPKYDYEDFRIEFELGRYVNGNITPIKDLKSCSKKECPYWINGKCWNSNGSYTKCTLERK